MRLVEYRKTEEFFCCLGFEPPKGNNNLIQSLSIYFQFWYKKQSNYFFAVFQRASTISNESKLSEFNQKLSESDRYLQILLNQIEELRIKSNNPDLEEEDRIKYEEISKKAIDSAESFKHAIVLLQVLTINIQFCVLKETRLYGLNIGKVFQLFFK